MVRENGEKFQTLYDEKRLYKLLSVQEQKDGTFVFRAELINKEERGMSDEERKKAQCARLREYSKEWLEGNLRLDGYILFGWWQGGVYDKTKKRGWVKSPGMAAYLPIAGSRWVYIWDTYGEYVSHPDPVWQNKRFTHFVETLEKPQCITTETMLAWLTTAKPSYDDACTPNNVWMPSVPLWLLDGKKDMRPLYLAGGKPE